MTITIDTTVDKLDSDLDRVYQKFSDDWGELSYIDVLVDTSKQLEEEHKGYFQSGKNPAGVQWPPLSKATIDRKGHARILIDTGRLLQALTRRSPDSIREVFSEHGRNHGLSFGAGVPYSIFHQKGMGRNPERKHVGIGRRFLDRLLRRVAQATVRKLIERRTAISEEL